MRGSFPLHSRKSHDWQRSGRLSAELAAAARSTIAYSDCFRLYDTVLPLAVPTTLERLAAALVAPASEAPALGLINVEDEPVIGAVLGCPLGIMRHPLPADQKGDLTYHRRFHDTRPLLRCHDEVARALRWRRLAPAWGVGTPVAIDDATLTDAWDFAAGETWFSPLIGQTIRQRAPARLARGLPLPEVQGDGAAPWVLASRHPVTGACAIGTLGRVAPAVGWREPRAAISVNLGDAPGPLAIFGRYERLTVQAHGLRPGLRILAQDLLADAAEDITAAVHLDHGRLMIGGDLIDRLGLAAATPGDASGPGLVLTWRP